MDIDNLEKRIILKLIQIQMSNWHLQAFIYFYTFKFKLNIIGYIYIYILLINLFLP